MVTTQPCQDCRVAGTRSDLWPFNFFLIHIKLTMPSLPLSPLRRRPFPLPGLATGGIPKALSGGGASSAGMSVGPPLAPPPARRSHSVLHEAMTSTQSLNQPQHSAQTSGASVQQGSQQISASSQGTSLMANAVASAAGANLKHRGENGATMLGPIQTEPVLTANKVILGSGPPGKPPGPTKSISQMRFPPSASHYGHVQVCMKTCIFE